MIHVAGEEELAAYVDGAWYQGAAGELYVLPLWGDLEPWGPDDAAMALLVTAAPGTRGFRRRLAEYKLVEVPHDRRRWSPAEGFYIA